MTIINPRTTEYMQARKWAEEAGLQINRAHPLSRGLVGAWFFNEVESGPPPSGKPSPCPICDGPTERQTREGKTGNWCDPCKSLSMPIEEVLRPAGDQSPAPSPIPEPGQRVSMKDDPTIGGW